MASSKLTPFEPTDAAISFEAERLEWRIVILPPSFRFSGSVGSAWRPLLLGQGARSRSR